MGLFSRRKDEPASDAPESRDERAGEASDTTIEPTSDASGASGAAEASAPVGDSGPLDRSLVDDDTDYLNLGALWLRGAPGMELRLEINEQEQQITGVTAVIGESAVQLQAFAAPRTEGVWVDIRNEISASITDNGGTAEVVSGEFGEELRTRMPRQGPTDAPSSSRPGSSASTGRGGSSGPSSAGAPPSRSTRRRTSTR